jgi:DNA-binding beta-propeller fold protein YncE
MPQDPDAEQNGVEMPGRAVRTGRTMEVGSHPRRRVGRRALRFAPLLVVICLASAALGATQASAAVGDLAFTACIGQLTGCTTTTPGAAVSQPRSVAVSADGKSVYVASANAIDVFSRDTTTGALTFTSCIGQLSGCTTTTPAGAVFGAESVVVSPDGKSVYAASYNAGAIDVFSRDITTGALTFENCIGQLSGCTHVAAVNGPFSVAISADGASVYIADNTYQSIDAFSRDTSTGTLTFESCVGQGAGCTTTIPPLAVKSPVSVTVSPDGTSVYAGSNATSGVDVFARDTTTGALTFENCIGVLAGCTPTSPAGAVGASYAVTVSPDGANVYSADGGSVLSTFSRATGSGALTFTGCIGQLSGCATTSPAGAVESPVSVTVSADGASVYVAADGANAVGMFSRSTSSGALTFTGCVGQLTGCTATSPATAVEGPQSVAVSPDEASVYAVSVDSNTVDLFPRVVGHTLAVTLAGSGSVTGSGISCPGTCSQTFPAGTGVTLTAAPASGSTFAGWSGECAGTSFTCTVTMSQARTVTASFAASGGSGSPGATQVTTTTTATTTAGVASTPRAIEELLLGCSSSPLVLNDVYIHGSRVQINGSAAKSLVGKKVKILFNEHKQVATATILASGQYSTTAPLPPARIREALTTRYTAEIGKVRSLHLKLTRRLLLEPPKASGTTVTLTGEVTPPLTKPIAPIVIEQQLECGKTTIVKRITPPANGHFHITLTVPANAKAGIYRLKSSVAANPHATKHGFTTFSLPLPLALG